MLPAHVFCSNCGVQNQKNATFCFSCGSQLARPDAADKTFQGPANAAGSGQQISSPIPQVSAPHKPVTEPPLAQGANPTITSPGDSTGLEISRATGFLSTNTILNQRYRILHSVGRGGMGAVYMGQDMQLGQRLVAIKEMSQGSLYPQEVQAGIESFKREAHLLAGLQHPNLPSIYDHFEQNQRWYLVMSFIQGETLQDYLKYIPGGKMPLEEVLKIGIELCTVLHYLHTYQPPIIFRDLKPSNIMRNKNGHIYLIDFGIARHFKPGQEKDTSSYASPGYAAPEQYGRAQTTPRSDIYSLGATLYHLLSGYAPSQSPFRLPPLQSLVPTLPPRLTSLITHMLDLEENRRPPDMMVIKQELEAIAGSPATPKGEKKTAKKPSSSKRVGAIALAGLGSVLLLVGLFLLIGRIGTVWYVYFVDTYNYSDYDNNFYGVNPGLMIGSILLLLGFFTLYIPWAKSLSLVAVTRITNWRKAIATIGVFLGCVLLVWGIWGWVPIALFIGYFLDRYNNSYILALLGFALSTLSGIFIILTTTTGSFGLSQAKSGKEIAWRIATVLAMFVLLFGTTFLQPRTFVIAIICFVVGVGVLAVAQMRQSLG